MMNAAMKTRMKWMLICFAVLFGSIFAVKTLFKFLMYRAMAAQSMVITVSAMPVNYSGWQPKLKASGSVRAVRGVNVTTELAGMVQTIYFTPGAFVKEGALLVQLNAASDIGQLHVFQANAELALTTYNRDKKQFAVHAISKETLDTDAANLKSAQAQVEQQTATVAKKSITAPFTGRLGISAVNPGQYVNTGDKVVTLQTLDPIYVDFYLPQQVLSDLKVGQNVNVSSDSFPGRIFSGMITTIDPAIDVSTRNIEVEATVSNPNFELTPGMFATVNVITGQPKNYLTLPQTAISFNPYGQVVYVIKQHGKDKTGKPILIANQMFVITGETRGDQITVLKGLKKGDVVVTSGQLKLKNGAQVAINNAVVPTNNPAPVVENE